MLRRLSASAVLAAVLFAVTAVPASAADAAPALAAPLTLTSYTVGVAGPPETAATLTSAPNCDSRQRINCGFVVLEASFAGLTDSPRTQRQIQGQAGYLGGTINVTRTYGCQNPGGKLVHRFDRTVTETLSLAPRGAGGFTIPATGNTLSTGVFAFLPDSQPGNCPKNFIPVNTSIVASGAKLIVTSSAPLSFGSGDYDAPKSASWYGVRPTPIAAYATA
jgi:hypothetical protein